MSLDIAPTTHDHVPAGEGPPAVDPGNPSGVLEVEDNLAADRVAAEDESQYPSGLKLFLMIFSVSLVIILGNMDGSIVSVAVPAITDHFHTVQDVGWYSTAFRLASCSFQFMFGKLYTIFAFKRVFFMSVAIFIVGSTLCAAAQTSAMFVFGRAVCGFAFSGIMAGCFTLLVLCIPMRKRPLYTGLVGSIGAVASIASPIIGGVIVDQLGWRWCFWIGLPLGFVALLGTVFCISDVKPPVELELTWAQRISKLDLPGNLLFLPSLTCLFVALGWAGSKYAWNSPTVIALFCTFGILIILFGFDQYHKGDEAALPPRILYNRSVLAGITYTLFCNSASMVVQYYLPTYFQAVRGYSAAQSGYFQFPIVVGDIIGVLFQSFGVSIIGYYTPFMLLGSVLMPIFAGLMTTVTMQMALAEILVFSGIYGFAGGVGFLSPQSAVQMSLPKADASMGLSVILFAEQFGPAVFVSAAQSIFENRLTDNLHQLVPSLNATGIESMGLSDLKSLINLDELDDVLLGLDKSLSQTWFLAVALACITMIGSATMEWKSIKQKRS